MAHYGYHYMKGNGLAISSTVDTTKLNKRRHCHIIDFANLFYN